MSTQELTITARELKQLRLMADELAAEIKALEDAIKAHMEEQDLDAISTTDVKITWKTVTSNRLDTTALKKARPEIVALYTKETTSRRFCVQ